MPDTDVTLVQCWCCGDRVQRADAQWVGEGYYLCRGCEDEAAYQRRVQRVEEMRAAMGRAA